MLAAARRRTCQIPQGPCCLFPMPHRHCSPQRPKGWNQDIWAGFGEILESIDGPKAKRMRGKGAIVQRDRTHSSGLWLESALKVSSFSWTVWKLVDWKEVCLQQLEMKQSCLPHLPRVGNNEAWGMIASPATLWVQQVQQAIFNSSFNAHPGNINEALLKFIAFQNFCSQQS